MEHIERKDYPDRLVKGKCKRKTDFLYWIIVITTAVLSYGYNITHFAIGVDDTAMKLYFEEGLSVCINRWTLFFLNRVLHLNIINWPTGFVECLAACLLVLSFSLWCFFINRILVSVEITLSGWFYGLAAAMAVSCPIMSEVWVYYLHNGVAIAYGLTALALQLFLQSLQHDSRHNLIEILGSGFCLAAALGCYETMMDCFLIGALTAFMILHALSDKRKNPTYDIRFFSWVVKGGIVLTISLLVRALMHEVLKSVYHLDNMAKYGMNEYNLMFGDLFVTPGEFGILIKKMYLRYYVNAVVYLPITFLVLSWVMIGSFAVFFTIKRRNPWIIICVPVMAFVPVLSSIVAGRAKRYHSAQFVPIVIMLGFIFFGVALHYSKGLKNRILTVGVLVIALGGIIVQIQDMNRWFIQDYNKYLEAKQIMTDVAENLIENYDIEKPIVVVGATLPSDELCREASIPLDSWKYHVIARLTSFDPTIKEKFHANYGGWGYFYTDSPLLSVLTWARNPFENCDLVASQQYTNFWEMIGYYNFTYVPRVEMIEEAEEIRKSSRMAGYPCEGYIIDNGDMLIVNLSEAKETSIQ